jgi:hypothetical protein
VTVSDGRRAFGALLTVITLVVVGISLFGGSDDGDDEQEVATATTAATTTTAPAFRTPTVDEPLRILVAGDSLVGWIAPALEAALEGEPIELVDDWKGSTGLVRTDYFDWPARLAEDLAAHDPEVVVVGFGGNDAQNLVVDDEVLLVGTPEWEEEYRRRVVEVLDLVEGPGRTVYWIGMPLTEAAALEEVRPIINGAVADAAEDRPWVHPVDTVEALTPDGDYRVFLADPDDPTGEEVRVRADDGVHPSPDGGRLIVRTFLDDLLAERDLA